METKITFSPDLNLSLADQALVLAWTTVRSQIDERSKSGFTTHEVTVKGVDIVGEGVNRKLLMVQARVDYTPKNGKRTNYGVNFISNAATILVAFRVAGNESTRISKIKNIFFRKKPPFDYHVVMIEQARWGRNDPNCLEIPGGLLADHENFDLKSWARGALREFREETGGNHAYIPLINPHNIRSLGAPIRIYPNISDQQRQFFVEIDVSIEQFTKIKQALTGRHGGVAKEGESTIVRVMPLMQAHNHLLEKGNAPDAFQAVSRYMKHIGCSLSHLTS